MLTLAVAITAARQAALEFEDVATLVKTLVYPNGPNSIPDTVEAWLDARAPSSEQLEPIHARWTDAVHQEAANQGTAAVVQSRSLAATTAIDKSLTTAIVDSTRRLRLPLSSISTAAGHGAASLAPYMPTGTIFVRNPSGVSPSPSQNAHLEDCVQGVAALTATLEDLLT